METVGLQHMVEGWGCPGKGYGQRVAMPKGGVESRIRRAAPRMVAAARAERTAWQWGKT